MTSTSVQEGNPGKRATPPTAILETCRPCPICSSGKANFNFSSPAEWLGANSPVPEVDYSYYRCEECDAVFLQHLPSQELLGKYYNSKAYQFQQFTADTRKTSDALNLPWLFYSWLIFPHPTGTSGKHLDYGCGSGHYLALTKRYGWQSAGVEFSDASAAYARSRGFRVILESEMDGEPNGSFDLVTLHHSLEHLPMPSLTLETLASKVRAGGTLVVEVPSLETIDFRFFGRYYAMIQAPLHLQFFSDRTMRHLTKKLPLKLVSCKTNFWTVGFLINSLLIALRLRLGLSLSRNTRTFLSALLYPLTIFPALLFFMLGCGGNARRYYFVKQ